MNKFPDENSDRFPDEDFYVEVLWSDNCYGRATLNKGQRVVFKWVSGIEYDVTFPDKLGTKLSEIEGSTGPTVRMQRTDDDRMAFSGRVGTRLFRCSARLVRVSGGEAEEKFPKPFVIGYHVLLDGAGDNQSGGWGGG